MLLAIIATGQSMTMELAATLRDTTCVAVNNACIDTTIDGITYPARAPHAVAVAANDHQFWRHYPQAYDFSGRKFSCNRIPGVEQVHSDWLSRQSSSGVLALEVARRLIVEHRLTTKARDDRIDLYGFDGYGAHYFGWHPAPLHRTTDARFAIFEQQLAALGAEMKKAGITIMNRTPGSALRCFPLEPA